jgi:hypothetical protein
MADLELESSSHPGPELFATFHCWSELPKHLKLEVFSHRLTGVLEHHCNLDDHDKRSFEEHLGPLLTAGNRELYDMAEEVYYANNIFCMLIEETSHTYSTEEWYNNPAVPKFPHPRIARMIRHLTVCAAANQFCKPPLEEIVLDASATSSWIFRPNRPLDPDEIASGPRQWLNTSRALTWQSNFTNLYTPDLWIMMYDVSNIDLSNGQIKDTGIKSDYEHESVHDLESNDERSSSDESDASDDYNADDDAEECWRWLFRPNQKLDVSTFSYTIAHPCYKKAAEEIDTYTAWQTSFSNIQSLTLDLEVCGFGADYVWPQEVQQTETSCCLKPEAKSKLVGRLSELKLMFKAKRVQARLAVYDYFGKTTCNRHSDLLEGIEKRAVRVD